jgi:hypothetical protein
MTLNLIDLLINMGMDTDMGMDMGMGLSRLE